MLTAALACRPGAEESTRRDLLFPTADVIVISIDTLRSDHLPAYGYRDVATPAIDSLRNDSILFERAYANVPLTLPSHVSMLTGVYPADHGVRDNQGYHFDHLTHPTLPSILRSRGYVAGAAVSAYVLRSGTGLGEAFDFYDDAMQPAQGSGISNLQRAGEATVAAALRWLQNRDERPVFFLLHLFEPHSPYAAPEPWASRYTSPYDAEIAAVDHVVGDFLEGLRESRLYDDAIIFLLSDHGEGLGNHGEAEHGIFLYREALQVPLLLKLPGRQGAGTTVERPVQLVDVLPTVGDLIGFDIPPGIRGVSLLAHEPLRAAPIFNETMYPRISFGYSELRSLIDGSYHYIAAPTPELFDLDRDPEELRNIAGNEPQIAARLARAIEPFSEEYEASPVVDRETAGRLEALGYMAPTKVEITGPLPDPKNRIGEIEALAASGRMAARGDVDGAISALQRLVDNNPAFTNAWLRLGQVLEAAGRLTEAISAYQHGITESPAVTGEASTAIALIYLERGELDEAEVHGRAAVEAGAGMGRLVLAQIALQRGDAQTAILEARHTIDDGVFRLPARILLAEATAATDPSDPSRLSEALEIADGVRAEITADHLAPIRNLEQVRGTLLGRMGRLDEAETAFRNEIRHFPGNRRAYTGLAVTYYVQGRSTAGRQVLEAMVKAIPGAVSLGVAIRTSEHFGDSAAALGWRDQLAKIAHNGNG